MKLILGPMECHLRLLARTAGVERLGFILGRVGDGRIYAYTYVAVSNAEGSPVRFTADPWDTIVAHKVAENTGLEVVAFHHTHPCGSARPSMLDLQGMRRWPIIWVISSPAETRAWKLDSGTLVEVGVEGCGSGNR